MTAPEFLRFNAHQVGREGFFTDFLGTRTRLAFLPEIWSCLSGKVAPYPTPTDSPLHEYGEWLGIVRAVVEAQKTFTGIELGAGWAPWSVIMHAATAACPHLERSIITAVEASREHC